MKAKFLDLCKKAALATAVSVIAFLAIPSQANAEEEDICLVLAYAEQEGMGNITSTCNDVPFKDSVEAKQGDVIIVKAEYYPRCTFEGWYVNGELKSTQKSYSFTANGPMCIATAKFRKNNDTYLHTDREKLPVSETSWANRTCRFAAGSGEYDMSVTTSMAVQGEACIAAFNTVLEDYKLARTYNITFTKPSGKNYETLNTPATLVFQIPQELQSPGRTFRMINVYKGQPTVMEDTDSSDTTLTFVSDKAGAYALVYKDAVVDQAAETTTDPVAAPAADDLTVQTLPVIPAE